MVTKNVILQNIELRKVGKTKKVDTPTSKLWEDRCLVELDKIDSEFSKLAKKTQDPIFLCYLAIDTKNPLVLDIVFKRSEFFDKHIKEFIVRHIASNVHTNPLTLDEIARGKYSIFIKMIVGSNPSTQNSTTCSYIGSKSKKLTRLVEKRLLENGKNYEFVFENILRR